MRCCQDCGSFFFLLDYHDRKIESTVIGKMLCPVTTYHVFGRFLLKNQLTDYNRIDTCTDFQTTKYLKPPPPPKPIDIQEFTSTKKLNK